MFSNLFHGCFFFATSWGFEPSISAWKVFHAWRVVDIMSPRRRRRRRRRQVKSRKRVVRMSISIFFSIFCRSEIYSSWQTFSWWGLEFFWTWSAGLKDFFWQLHSVKMGRMESFQQLGLSYHMSQVVVLYIVCMLHLHMTHVDVRCIIADYISICIL